MFCQTATQRAGDSGSDKRHYALRNWRRLRMRSVSGFMPCSQTVDLPLVTPATLRRSGESRNPASELDSRFRGNDDSTGRAVDSRFRGNDG